MNMNKIMKAVAAGALKAIGMGAASMIASELITGGLRKFDTIDMAASPSVEQEQIEVPIVENVNVEEIVD